MSDTINILIAARNEKDQKHILAAISGQMDLSVIGIVKDESSAIIKSEYLKPDILILDLQLSEITGPKLVRIIRRRSPSTSVIILSDGDVNDSGNANDSEKNPLYMGKQSEVNPVFIHTSLAITAGTSGFLLKKSDISILTEIINIIYKGGQYIDSSIASKALETVTSANQFPQQTEDTNITATERDVILLLARGFSDAQIADKLNYCTGTIRNHLTEIRQKTKMNSRIEIVNYFIFSGLISLEHLWMWKERKNNDIMNTGGLF